MLKGGVACLIFLLVLSACTDFAAIFRNQGGHGQPGKVVAASSRQKKSPSHASKNYKIAGEYGKFLWPVRGDVTGTFGPRGGAQHDGIDISAPLGTPIRAAAGGKIVYSGSIQGYGNLIVVKHRNNYFTAYAHNQKNLVSKGTKVTQGQIIATVGQTGRVTGPHVHFEIREKMAPRNPLFFLPETR